MDIFNTVTNKWKRVKVSGVVTPKPNVGGTNTTGKLLQLIEEIEKEPVPSLNQNRWRVLMQL